MVASICTFIRAATAMRFARGCATPSATIAEALGISACYIGGAGRLVFVFGLDDRDGQAVIV